MKKKNYTGFTPETMENLLLDVGAIFRGFKVGVDTYESAVKEGKLLGATQGGGEFNAAPEIRYVEIDGIPSKTKGTALIEEYATSLKINVLEITLETIKAALCAVEITEDEEYTTIKGNHDIQDTDYIDNITWVGTLSGSSKPCIIQLFNALNQNGLALKPVKKGEAVFSLEFAGHYDSEKLEEPPYAIHYPKKKGVVKNA